MYQVFARLGFNVSRVFKLDVALSVAEWYFRIVHENQCWINVSRLYDVKLAKKGMIKFA